jgi:diguanylate cyclase (GGDEF)-like protein/PAS domain S-box-containing protein
MARPERNAPWAMLLGVCQAVLFFAVLPLVWLGTVGEGSLTRIFSGSLAPTFAPLLGGMAKSAAVWLLVLCTFEGTVQPIAGASRTLFQLADDGLLPAFLAKRSPRSSAPGPAIVITGIVVLAVLQTGETPAVLAASALAYLISIGLCSAAPWLLRRDAPTMARPFRVPKPILFLGCLAACCWLFACVFGLAQYGGISTALLGFLVVLSGSGLLAIRRWSDKTSGGGRTSGSLQTNLTISILLVIAINCAAFLYTLGRTGPSDLPTFTMLSDVFVCIVLLAIVIGLVVPGLIACSAETVSGALENLAAGPLDSLSRATNALANGNINALHVCAEIEPLQLHVGGEMSRVAFALDLIQQQVENAADGMNRARKRLQSVFQTLTETNERLAQKVEDLRKSRERYELCALGSNDGLWDWDVTKGSMYHSMRCYEMVGHSLADLPDTVDAWNELFHPEDRDAACNMLTDYMAECRPSYEAEFRVLHKDGTYRWILSRGAALRDKNGKAIRMTGSFTDISDRKKLEEEREHLLRDALSRADRDPLTGLWNHRAFHKRLQEECDRSTRTGVSVAIMMIDLDNFKFFNDAYGHAIGDDVLRSVAELLGANCRSYDMLARFGGDEFAVIAPTMSKQTLPAFMARLSRGLEGAGFRPPGYDVQIPLSLSMGVSLFPDDAPARLDALAIADERLRNAKGGELGEDSEFERLCAELTRTQDGFGMLNALVASVDNKDRYTRKHSQDVMLHCVQIANELGMDPDSIQNLRVAALLHDVGKIGVPDNILRKPGKLTDDEILAIQQHPTLGFMIVSAVPGFEETLPAIKHHHERWDGKGYPANLAGEDTPRIARLMAVADAYSAMTTDRPYRKGMPSEKALDILRKGAAEQWDAQMVDAFLRAMQRETGDTEIPKSSFKLLQKSSSNRKTKKAA